MFGVGDEEISLFDEVGGPVPEILTENFLELDIFLELDFFLGENVLFLAVLPGLGYVECEIG